MITTKARKIRRMMRLLDWLKTGIVQTKGVNDRLDSVMQQRVQNWQTIRGFPNVARKIYFDSGKFSEIVVECCRRGFRSGQLVRNFSRRGNSSSVVTMMSSMLIPVVATTLIRNCRKPPKESHSSRTITPWCRRSGKLDQVGCPAHGGGGFPGGIAHRVFLAPGGDDKKAGNRRSSTQAACSPGVIMKKSG